jgi:hypothetical protein
MAMKRKPPAIDGYNEAAAAEDLALSRGLKAAGATHTPRDAAEAAEMMRDPFEAYERDHDNLLAAFKPVVDGQCRKAGRPAKPANSNDDALRLLEGHDPDLYKGDLTVKRVSELNHWLHTRHSKPRRRSDDTLARAIRRERQTMAAIKFETRSREAW